MNYRKKGDGHCSQAKDAETTRALMIGSGSFVAEINKRGRETTKEKRAAFYDGVGLSTPGQPKNNSPRI